MWKGFGARPDQLHGHCWECDQRRIVIIEHESPPRDPSCFEHGVPTPETRRNCWDCDTQVRVAKRKGWTYPGTGHEGPECWGHCDVCGLCRVSGRVCRYCWRCPDHELDLNDPFQSSDCIEIRWDRFVREDRLYFEHRLWTPEDGWAA